jgi:hypothetical protein
MAAQHPRDFHRAPKLRVSASRFNALATLVASTKVDLTKAARLILKQPDFPVLGKLMVVIDYAECKIGKI